VIKYRPAKKAAIHLRALGLVDEEGAPTEEGLMCQLDRDGNSADPSPRIWLGNIAPTTTSKSLHAVLGRCALGRPAGLLLAWWGAVGSSQGQPGRIGWVCPASAAPCDSALNTPIRPPLVLPAGLAC
jgi:hypothetical protein